MISRLRVMGVAGALMAILVAVLAGSGCQTLTIYVDIKHPPLEQAPLSHGTRVLVKPFADQRVNQGQLGQFKRMGTTINYLTFPDVSVEEMLTMSVVQALNAAGYRAELMKVLPEAELSGSAIVEGDVKECSVTLSGMGKGRCAIQVNMRVKNPQTHVVSCERLISGEDRTTLVLGAPVEYNGIAMRAMKRFRDCAKAEFLTTEFQNAIRPAEETHHSN